MKYSKEFTIGLSILIAGVIFVLGIRFFEDLPLFRGTYELNTAFNDAGGMTAGNAVRVNGVRVGAVEEINLDPESNRVLVRFHVDRKIAVPEGSFTTVGGIAALGSVHMEVHLGPPANPRIAEGGFLPGRPAGGLLDQFTTRGPQLAGRLDTLLASAQGTFEGTQYLIEGVDPDVRGTFASLRAAAGILEMTLRAEQQRLGATLSNLERFSGEMTRFGGDVSRFSEENVDTLTQAVQRLNRAMAQLDRTVVQLEASTVTLDEILFKMNEGDGTLGRLLNDPAVYARLDSTLMSLNRLIEDFENNPRKYLRHMTLVDIF